MRRYHTFRHKMKPKRSPQRRRKPAQPTRELATSAPRVRMSAGRLGANPLVAESPPTYQVETLSNAIAKLTATKDLFITPSIQEAMGPAPILSMTFDLLCDGDHRLVFRLAAVNAKRKRASFGFVVTKQSGKAIQAAKKEEANLRHLAEREPKWVLNPLRSGAVFLPARKRVKAQGRDVYAYVTEPLTGYPLTFLRGFQWGYEHDGVRRLSGEDEENVKFRIVEGLARLYNDETRQAMAPPQIGFGDVLVSFSKKRVSGVKFIACRGLRRIVKPEYFLNDLLTEGNTYGTRKISIVPADPSALLKALVRGAGQDTAMNWITQYLKAVENGRLPETHALPADRLKEVI